MLKLALRYARYAVVTLTGVGSAIIPAEEAGGEPLQGDASTCCLSLQLPGDVIAWMLAWVAASLAHGLGGQDRAYLYQTQRALRCERLQTVVVHDPKSEPLLRLQGEHVTPMMSDFRGSPGKTAPHLASSLGIL